MPRSPGSRAGLAGAVTYLTRFRIAGERAAGSTQPAGPVAQPLAAARGATADLAPRRRAAGSGQARPGPDGSARGSPAEAGSAPRSSRPSSWLGRPRRPRSVRPPGPTAERFSPRGVPAGGPRAAAPPGPLLPRPRWPGQAGGDALGKYLQAKQIRPHACCPCPVPLRFPLPPAAVMPCRACKALAFDSPLEKLSRHIGA